MGDINEIIVAYILLRFPKLTETFIAEEIREVQNHGINIQIFSLLQPEDALLQPVSAELVGQAKRVPGLLQPSLWLAQIYFLFKATRQYFRLLWTLLKQPAPGNTILVKRLVIFFKAIWLAKHLKNSGVQLVHSHFAWLSAAAGMIVSQLLDIPFTITTHAYDLYSVKNDLLTLTTSQSDRLVTISEFNKRAMLSLNQCLKEEKIKVIHCGIDLENFRKRKKNQTNDSLKIISVGSLIEKKGHEYLIRACKELAIQGKDFECTIIGEGELRRSLQKTIVQLGLESRVKLAGMLTQVEVRNKLNEMDCFVLACVDSGQGGVDGIPVAIMEAMAMQVPVVSTDVSGIPELVQQELTGLLVPQKDINALVRAITEIDNNKMLGQFLATNGRQIVEKEYDITQNAKTLSCLFREVIEQASSQTIK